MGVANLALKVSRAAISVFGFPDGSGIFLPISITKYSFRLV